jgi:osmoprotectant transport system substrate-binding protein
MQPLCSGPFTTRPSLVCDTLLTVPRLVLILLLGPIFLLTACAPPRSHRITIGAKNFTEQVVLGELLAQQIESISHQKVDRRFYLAGSYLCHQALVSGRIDAYPEYTGTALTAILKQPLPPPGPGRSPQQVLATITRLYAGRFHIKVEPGFGFEDTFAMVVRTPDAQKNHWRTLSDIVPSAPSLRLGVGYEFQSRPDGLPALTAAYGLHFSDPRVMDLGLLYRALSANQVDLIAGNSTDGPIQALHLTILADDRHAFPPYDAVPLVREDSLKLHPEIQIAIDQLAGRITAQEMQTMNDAVDAKHEDVAQVVRTFRTTHHL